MVRSRVLSAQAQALLGALLEAGEAGSHGYALAKLAGLKSGTLYPLLIRLEQRGLLEAQWQQPADPGRPPRHAYRLTALGRAEAMAAQAGAAPTHNRPVLL